VHNSSLINASKWKRNTQKYKDGLDGNWLTPHQLDLSLHPYKYPKAHCDIVTTNAHQDKNDNDGSGKLKCAIMSGWWSQ
jgi:hypothetical protein